MIIKRVQLILFCILTILINSQIKAQGNKLSIRSTSPKNISICGFSDTSRITVYNISPSVINGSTLRLNLPPGVNYVAGSLVSSTVSESNITNPNRPIFKSGKLLLAQSYTLRVSLKADCELMYKLGGSFQPQIDVRVDYAGNFDLGSSLPFAPNVPSPVLSSITNRSYTGDVGSSFVRKYTIKNFGKGPIEEFYFYRINGKDLKTTVQKDFVSTLAGDTLKTKITKAQISQIGNKDSFFDRNESIVFSDTILIQGCKSLGTNFLMMWGCNNQLCQIIKNNGSVNISTKAPNIKSWAKSSSSTCQNNTIANAQELVITNTGQLAAINGEVYIYQSYGNTASFYKYLYSRIDTSSIFIRKSRQGKQQRIYPSSVENNQTYSCLGKDPIGSFLLNFGDLEPGDSLIINWDLYKCTPTNCGSSFYNQGWSYRVNYSDACGDRQSTYQRSGKSGALSRASLSIDAPTDIASGITEKITYTFNSTNFLPMDTSAKIYIDLILPKTLSHSLSTKDFYISNYRLTNSWYPDSVQKHGDTIRGYFGNRVKMNITNGELYIKVTGNCNNSKKNENLPVTLQVKYNTNANCNPNVWINMACNTANIKVHCDFSCSGGMQFKNFDVKRINFGLPDNDNDGLADKTGTLDTSKLRTERAMYGDTILASFYGRPKSAGGLNRAWSNGFAQSIVSYGKYLDVIDAELVVIKGSTFQSSGCTSVKHKKTVSGNNATFDFDFSVDSIYRGGCLSSTYRYSKNDSLILKVRYRIAENVRGNTVNLLFKNRYYLSNYASPTLAQSYQCDTFNGRLTYLGYYFTNYGRDNRLYGTCGALTVNQSFYLGIGKCCSNYSGNDAFPYEYRNWATMDKLRVHLPKGMGFLSANFYQLRTTGRGSSVRENVLNIKPLAGYNNPMVFDLKKLYKANGGVVNAGDDGFNGYVSFQLQPLCDFPTDDPQIIDYDYVFEKHNALGSGFDTLFSKTIGTSDRVTLAKPKIGMIPDIQTVYANTDTAEWELRYSNSSTSFQVYNVWLSQKKNNNIKIVEIWDVENDTLVKPTNDIFRAGPLGAGKVRRFKIRATYNNCSPDSLIIYGAWACDGYPINFSSYDCTPEKMTLFLEPKNTRLQLTLEDSAALLNLCSENKMEVLLENIQDVNSYSNKLQLVLPIGMKIVPGTIQVEYPTGKAMVSLPMPDLITGTTVQWDLDKLLPGFSGGFSGTVDTSKNKVRVVFKTTTNCDYASGSYMIAKAEANINCGDPVLVVPAYSRPLDIIGITRPYYTLAEIKSDSILPCTKPFDVSIKSIILGPDKTAIKDRIEILMPEGMSWDSSYFSKIRNAPFKDSFVISDINGATLVSWLLPSNIKPGDSIEFKTRFNAKSENFFCGVTDLSVRTVVVQSALCVETNKYCDIKVVTGGELINPVVDKASLKLSPLNSTSYMLRGDSEKVNLSYVVRNEGQDISSSQAIIINYYFDKNADGKWDVSDKFLSSDTVNKILKKNEQLSVSKSMDIVAGESCAIIAIIDSSACSCLYGQMIFPAPHLINAGRDTAICSGSLLLVGGVNNYKFRYSWNNSAILNDPSKARTLFIAKNQSGKPEQYDLVLSTDRGNCFSKDTVKVVVNPLPQISMNFKDTQICTGAWLNLAPKINSGVLPFIYSWKSSFPLKDSSKASLYVKPDSHTFYHLFLKDKNGCSDLDSTNVQVFKKPIAEFNFPITCANKELIVSNSSFRGTSNWSKVIWSTSTWDTLNIDTTAIPMGGLTEDVELIVINDANCADTIKKQVNKKALPRALFTAVNHCLNATFELKNGSVSDSGSIIEYYWQFDDGSSSGDRLPSHAFKTADSFNVSLRVKSEFDCTDSIAQAVVVHPIPQVDFAANAPCEGQALKIVNKSTLTKGFVDLVNWSSKYGNGTADSLELMLNTFDSFQVKLIVSSNFSCMDSVEKQVRVFDKPKANFSVADVCDGVSLNLIDSSEIRDGTIVRYQWKFGDGTNSGMINPTHTYGAEGIYFVEQKVISNFGCQDSVSIPVEVFPLLQSDISVDDHCFGFNQRFSSTTTGTGILDQLHWNLGNSDSQSLASFNYLYSNIGRYTIELETKTTDGCITKKFRDVEVFPLPNFKSIFSKNPCSDEKVSFETTVDINTGTVASVDWIFKDNTSLSGFAVTRDFSLPTKDSVSVIAKSNRGCIDSTSVVFQSFEKVVPLFSVGEVCLDESSLFEDLSTSYLPIRDYSWDFGDGEKDFGKTVTHKYASSGTFNCTHRIITIPGCEYEIINPAIVHPKPIPSFGLDPKRSIITDAYISVSDLSTGADSVWYRYEQSILNSNRNFIHRFPDSGFYRIHQYVLNRFGCMDSTSDEVYIDFLYTLFVPNAFSPNDIPPNDVFKPEGLGHINYELIIYDRWGGTIYKEANGAWDGSSEGKVVPDGVYPYLIILKDYKDKNHYHKGIIHLLR